MCRVKKALQIIQKKKKKKNETAVAAAAVDYIDNQIY